MRNNQIKGKISSIDDAVNVLNTETDSLKNTEEYISYADSYVKSIESQTTYPVYFLSGMAISTLLALGYVKRFAERRIKVQLAATQRNLETALK